MLIIPSLEILRAGDCFVCSTYRLNIYLLPCTRHLKGLLSPTLKCVIPVQNIWKQQMALKTWGKSRACWNYSWRPSEAKRQHRPTTPNSRTQQKPLILCFSVTLNKETRRTFVPVQLFLSFSCKITSTLKGAHWDCNKLFNSHSKFNGAWIQT